MTRRKQKQKEIIEYAIQLCKQIDENPFIMKKIDIFWRVAAYQVGIKNPKSQAEYMKEQIMLQAKAYLLETK